MSKVYNDIVRGIAKLLGELVTKIDDPEERAAIDALINCVTSEPNYKKLNDYTWEEIRRISDNGEATNYFSIGDTKTITINGSVAGYNFDNLSIDAFIIGINHNSQFEGSNRIHFQIGKIKGFDVALIDDGYSYSITGSECANFVMNKSDTNIGGWFSSYMRTTVLGGDSSPISPAPNTLLAALPPDLRAVMKPVTKYSDNIGNGIGLEWCISATTDYLTLLSEFEYHGVQNFANRAEEKYQKQYEYYAECDNTIKGNHKYINLNTHHWCRSVHSNYSTHFCFVSMSGYAYCNNATTSRGIAPCFTV